MDSKAIKSYQCSLENLMLYRLNLILNSDQGLVHFRQKQIFSSNRQKNVQKQNTEDFFIQLLIGWLHFINNATSLPSHL